MFQIHIPAVKAFSVKEALKLIEENGKVLNGGTDILVIAKEIGISAEKLVDISGIEELKQIEVSAKKIVIGGAVTIDEAKNNPIIRSEFPALVFAAEQFASPQIRNRATWAGNIANASPAGDGMTALYAYDAVIQLRSKNGRRKIPLTEFVKGVRKTQLCEGEIITGIILPRGHGGEHFGSFIKVGQRKTLAISKVMVAVSALIKAGKIKKIGIALGAVAPVILRLTEVEQFLTGKKIDRDEAVRAGELARQAVKAIDDIRSTADYRKKVAGVIVERAILGLKSIE